MLKLIMQIYTTRADFRYNKRRYTCYVVLGNRRELRIQNFAGKTLVVKQGQRSGILQIDSKDPKKVDVTQPYFYNLIRAAVQALETEERNKVILEKDQLITGQKQVIDGKNDQINVLKQQIGILNQKLNQLTSEQQLQLKKLQGEIQQQEAEARGREDKIRHLESRIQSSFTVRDSSKIVEKLQSTLGSPIWHRVSEAGQQNLIAAVSNYEIARQRDFLRDYSEAVSRLGIVVEVEIISPFFDSLYAFLNERNSSRSSVYNVGNV